MAKQDDEVQVDDLPTLDDFTESSLLDVVETDEEEEQEEEQEQEDQNEEEEKPKPKSKKKAPVNKNPLDEEEEEEDPDEDEDEEEEEEPKDKKKSKAKSDSDDDDDLAEETSDTFWNDVEQITGVNVEVDYGDVDPESPEGAAIREAALVDKVESGIWDFIQKNHPKVYKALELEAAGGSITDIITPDYVDYSKLTLDPENESQHKKILLDYYMEVKKLSENKAKRMVEADEDSEDEDGLFKAAEEALKERQETQAAKEEEIVNRQKEEAKKQQRRDEQLVGYVKSVTDEGNIGNFNLPRAERDEFFNFFVSTIQRAPQGGYMFAMPLSQENFDQTMEQAYFAFKGGKLDKLVERRAKTESTRTIKRRLKRSDTKRPSGSSSTDAQDRKRKDGKKLPTMDYFSAE